MLPREEPAREANPPEVKPMLPDALVLPLRAAAEEDDEEWDDEEDWDDDEEDENEEA